MSWHVPWWLIWAGVGFMGLVAIGSLIGAFLGRGDVEPPSVPDIDEDEMKARIDAVLDEWAS